MTSSDHREDEQQTEWQRLYHEDEESAKAKIVSSGESFGYVCAVHFIELLFSIAITLMNAPGYQEYFWLACKTVALIPCAYFITKFELLTDRATSIFMTIYFMKMLYDLLSTVAFGVYLLWIYEEMSTLELVQLVLWFRNFAPSEASWNKMPEYVTAKTGKPFPLSSPLSDELLGRVCGGILSGVCYFFSKTFQMYNFLNWWRHIKIERRYWAVREELKYAHLEEKQTGAGDDSDFDGHDISEDYLSPWCPSPTALRRR